jgi:lipopolysaccharide/colanic/teichoic acid biosynthesis glycosyltransferase
MKYIKRILDLNVAVVLLILLMPLYLFVSVIILILEGSPILYLSKRFIKIDKEVTIYKFRTMVKDASSTKYQLIERFMKNGYLDIPLSCEVYTNIGRILERTQIVESLQLINVVFHGMSLIGNRPLPKHNVERLKIFDNWELRFESPAGMTGIAQVVGKFNFKSDERLKIESLYSEVYLNGNIIKCDLLIIYYTIRLIIFNRNISIEKAYSLLNSCL